MWPFKPIQADRRSIHKSCPSSNHDLTRENNNHNNSATRIWNIKAPSCLLFLHVFHHLVATSISCQWFHTMQMTNQWNHISGGTEGNPCDVYLWDMRLQHQQATGTYSIYSKSIQEVCKLKTIYFIINQSTNNNVPDKKCGCYCCFYWHFTCNIAVPNTWHHEVDCKLPSYAFYPRLCVWFCCSHFTCVSVFFLHLYLKQIHCLAQKK